MRRKATKTKFDRDKKGMTLVETLVGIALVSFVMMSIYVMLAQVIRLMADSKQQIGATALATERTEFYRNQSYENIPIIDPPITSNIERSGFNYEVETSIVLIDDPENGVNEDGDYKQAKVAVRWVSGEKPREVFFVNNFAPTGISHGTILVKAYDGEDYSSLGGALVKLEGVGSAYTVSQTTDASTGIALFWGLEEDVLEYKVTITKDGYETVQTFDPDNVSYDPINKNITLIDMEDSALRYYPLRRTSDLIVKAIDEEEDDVPGIDVELVGGQKYGNDPDTYDYDDTGTPQQTDSSGEISYENTNNTDSKMSPGYYQIANIDDISGGGFEFIGAKDNEYPLLLWPGISDTLELQFVDETRNCLLVKVTDSSDGVPVAGALVNASSETLSYDESVSTDNLGYAFFRFDDDAGVFEELAAGDYELEVSADGYDNNSATVTISTFTSEDVSLDLIE